MPDWKRVIKDIAESLEAAAREANARQRAQAGRSLTTRQVVQSRRECLFWDCHTFVPASQPFCYEHFRDLQDGLIDECPGCGQAKDVEYEVCLNCYRRRRSQVAPSKVPSARSSYRWYKPEYSEAWDKGDATAARFFVYILKLDDGKFYAGQTRELRERLSENKDGKVASTARQHPKLVWFGMVPSREAATAVEVELKKLVDTNPREIRRMVIGFRDLVQELQYE